MNSTTFNSDLFTFLQQSTSPFHAVQTMKEMLLTAGFRQIHEYDTFSTIGKGGFFCIRDDGAIAAFFLPENCRTDEPFRLIGCHSDSPSLQIKPNPDSSKNGLYQAAVEIYGGPLLSTWFDRELSFSGRVTYLDRQGALCRKLVDARQSVAYIPSLAIHLDRSANKEKTIDRQKEMVPILGLESTGKIHFDTILHDLLHKEYPDAQVQQILGFDLFLYDIQGPAFCGLNEDFIIGSRLDNLLSCFVALQALLSPSLAQNTILLCTNHEEIGSMTMSGAQGNFLSSLFERLIPDPEARYAALAQSLFLSLDNAHANHPNFPEKNEASSIIALNKGPVIKNNAAQRYATTSYPRAIFRILAQEMDITTQDFVMRNDMPCGSTIGPLLGTKLGIPTVDIGIATLGMHSIREMTGSKDPWLMYQVIGHFLERESLPRFTS